MPTESLAEPSNVNKHTELLPLRHALRAESAENERRGIIKKDLAAISSVSNVESCGHEHP